MTGRPSSETEDRAVAPPTPPEQPLSPAEPDHPALPNDDFWNRVNEELAADAEGEPDGPSRAASAGPPPPAAAAAPRGAGGRSATCGAGRPTGARTTTPGRRSAPSDRWNAWAPSVSGRPGSPSAGDEDEPRDHAGEGAAGKGAEAGTLGPLFAWRDAVADRAGARDAAADHAGAPDATADDASAGGAGKEAAAAGKEAADAEKQADAKAEEPGEEEEAAPSPWSIPLTLVDDLGDLDDEDGGQSAGAAEDHGTSKPPAAGETPAPERTTSDVWTRPSWASTQEKRAGSAQTDGGSGPEQADEADRAGAGADQAGAGADRGPWLTRPGRGTTAGWGGGDPGDVPATHAGDKADAPDAEDGADDHARAAAADRNDAITRAGRDDAIAGAGRDDAATRAARDEADVRPGRDDAAIRADRDDADVRAARDNGADDQAKATGAARVDDDAASRTRADTDADAAAGTSAASAGSASTASAGSASTPEEPGPRTDGEAKPPSATPAEKAAPVGTPSATLFEPAIKATPGSSPDPVTEKTAGPGTQREAPSAAEGADGQRAPEAGGGTGAGQTGPTPAAARGGDERGAADRGGAEKGGPAPATDGNAVVIVPGVARYHRTGCILIRFLGGDDLETSTAQEAEAKGCAPCRACEPDKPLSSEN